MLWKKTSTNYSKWDYFTSSSESENEDAEPIVPKNDPNFQALEKDLEERAKKRKEARQKAETWKLKGNEFLQNQDYIKAVEMYTKGLEEIKDYKALYTNRALANLHLGKFQQVVKDCDQVLEYCDCFEDSYEKSRDACFKSFLRKAVALKELKQFKEAGESVKEARTLMPKNEEGRKLQEEILFILKHEQAAKEIKESQEQIKQEESKEEEKQQELQPEEQKASIDGLSYKERVDSFLKLSSPTKDDLSSLELSFKSKPDGKIYFYENKGIPKFLSFLKNDQDCYALMNVFFDNNIYYQTEFAKAGGIIILLEKIDQYLGKCNENKQLYDQIEEIFELMVTFSLQEQFREWFKTESKLIPKLLQTASAHLLINFNNETNVLTSYFSFLTNIVFGGQSSNITQFIHNHKVLFFTTIRDILSIFRAKQKFILLKQHTLTFLSNLLTNKEMRDDISQEQEVLGYLVYNLTKINLKNDKNDFRWVEHAEGILGIFSNLTFQPEKITIQQLQKFKLAQKMQVFLIEILTDYSKQIDKVGVAVARGMQVLVRIQMEKEELNDKFCDWLFKCFEQSFIAQVAHQAIKVFITLMADTKYSINQQAYFERFQALSPKLHQFVTKSEDEALFCNTCSLLKVIVERFPQLIIEQKPIISLLIDTCKDKLGKIRKNAAILLATLAKNSKEMLEVVRELHGMDVLTNVSSFILDKNA